MDFVGLIGACTTLCHDTKCAVVTSLARELEHVRVLLFAIVSTLTIVSFRYGGEVRAVLASRAGVAICIRFALLC